MVSPNDLSFGTIVGGLQPPQQELTIINAGDGSLSVGTTVTTVEGPPWLSVSPTQNLAPATLTVSADSSGLPVGVYTEDLTIEAAALNSPQTIPVTLVVDPPPVDGADTLELRIASGEDDGGETKGKVKLSKSRLEVGRGQFLAFRFVGVTIPPGAMIESAAVPQR